MLIRTYLRTIFNDILKKNVIYKTFAGIVNFYCKLWSKNTYTLKFQTNLSIKDMKRKKTVSFRSVTGDQIDCK